MGRQRFHLQSYLSISSCSSICYLYKTRDVSSSHVAYLYRLSVTIHCITGNLFILATSRITMIHYFVIREFVSGSLRYFNNEFSTDSFGQARPRLGVTLLSHPTPPLEVIQISLGLVHSKMMSLEGRTPQIIPTRLSSVINIMFQIIRNIF